MWSRSSDTVFDTANRCRVTSELEVGGGGGGGRGGRVSVGTVSPTCRQ